MQGRRCGQYTAAIADELIKAVNTLSSLDFESIRRDRFPLKPESIYDSLVQNLNFSKHKLRDESKRREAWLKAPSGDVIDDEVSVPVPGPYGDVFGCDPDSFARPANHFRPYNWKDAVKNASLIHIDEPTPL